MLKAEYWRLFFLGSLGGGVGLLFDDVIFGLLLASLFYITLHLRNVYRLGKWLTDSKTSAEPPEGKGVWELIFNQIYRLQTRNKNQKIKLAAALTRFQDAASAMPDGMLILKHDGKIDWFNQSSRRLLGLKKPQDIGQSITNLIRYPAFKLFIESDSFSDEGIEILSPANEKIIIHIRLVPYGKGKALMVSRDITRVNQLEEIRRDFVANISHELRTPLTVLTGYMETLLSGEKSTENKWHDPMQQMFSQTDRMQSLVKDLLLLARLEGHSGNISDEVVDVSTLIDALQEDALMLGVDKKQNITVDYDRNLKLKGKHEDIQSAFSNLVSNAVRYTPLGGEIKIKWYADSQGAHFVVTDSGVGIAQQDIPRLTERFFRADEARSRATGGTGLGLAIVKHVLNRHNGSLEIHSVLGEGSRFTCHFLLDSVEFDHLNPVIKQ